MNYKQTLSYLYKQLPMFHRIGAAAYKADLNNTIAICKLLGNPENKFKSIHIAGTNGKGSTSHMLAAVFQSAGYKTGLYTSPHLKDFRERVKINGKKIPQKKVIAFVKKNRRGFEKIKPSFFEWTVGLAFDYFAEQKVDIAIIETGLGGRLDSTNVIKPELSLITNIGYDHTALLGKTLKKIATEKAGIIKPQVPVIVSETQKNIQSVFIKKAKENRSPLVFADAVIRKLNAIYEPDLNTTRFSFRQKRKLITLSCDLPGLYQQHNIAGVLVVLDKVKRKFPISDEHLRKGISSVKKITGLRGRWDMISKKPRVIADTGHNAEGIKEVINCIAREYRMKLVSGKLHVVLGAVNDKDVSTILKALAKNKHFAGAAYYFCKPAIPRGLDAEILRQKAADFNLHGSVFPSAKKALSSAKKSAKSGEMVFVGGSTFVVAEII